jgi:hypothetical protein
MSGVKTVACPVTTLAQLMDDLQLRSAQFNAVHLAGLCHVDNCTIDCLCNTIRSTVALVKINVERAELQVLRSVMTPVHWQRIQQVCYTSPVTGGSKSGQHCTIKVKA